MLTKCKQKINLLPLPKQEKYLVSQNLPSSNYQEKAPLLISELLVDTEDINYPKLNQQITQTNIMNNQQEKKTSATVESLLVHKKKTWKHKLDTLELNTLITKLSQTLDQESTLKEKDLTPFWTSHSKDISKKLWLPTKIDYVDSALSLSTESYKHAPMGKSWFSIMNKQPQKKNLLMTSFQSSQYSLPVSMDSEAIPLKTKSKKRDKKIATEKVKTIKIKLNPTNEQKKILNTMMAQFRWYYNSTLGIIFKHYKENPEQIKYQELSFITIRNLCRKYKLVETEVNNLVFLDFEYDEENNAFANPKWLDSGINDIAVHSRTPVGAIKKCVQSINSAVSNRRNGNIRNFNMKYITKKSKTEIAHYDDQCFPKVITNIESKYWYTTKDRKRTYLSFKDIFNDTRKRGCEIIHEKDTDRYFVYYPVDVDWYPSEDRRIENQDMYNYDDSRIISLDPGVRKFMVGYDPKGSMVFIGEGASKIVGSMLLEIDSIEDTVEKNILWRKVKNYIDELHWKTISYIIRNYDIILLPEFRVSDMLRKKKLNKQTKRLLGMFSFYTFKERLKYKCSVYNKKVIIVDESYTSKTCGVCGILNEVGSSEVYRCCSCSMVLDRDVNGARNIMIKNIEFK